MTELTNLSQAVFDLKRDVRQMLRRFNSARPLRETAQGLNLDPGAAMRTVNALITAGLPDSGRRFPAPVGER